MEREYEVTITEVLERKIRCRAPDKQQAIEQVERDYRAGKIILEAEDFSYKDITGREFLPVKEKIR